MQHYCMLLALLNTFNRRFWTFLPKTSSEIPKACADECEFVFIRRRVSQFTLKASLFTVTWICVELLLIRSLLELCVIINIPPFVSAVKVSVISLHYACSYNSTVMQWEAVSHIASRFYRPLLFEWNWNPLLNNWKCLLRIVYLRRAPQFI